MGSARQTPNGRQPLETETKIRKSPAGAVEENGATRPQSQRHRSTYSKGRGGKSSSIIGARVLCGRRRACEGRRTTVAWLCHSCGIGTTGMGRAFQGLAPGLVKSPAAKAVLPGRRHDLTLSHKVQDVFFFVSFFVSFLGDCCSIVCFSPGSWPSTWAGSTETSLARHRYVRSSFVLISRS